MTEAWVDYLTGPWGFAFAFAAGLLSFLSPCVLPLVPAYLAHMTGTVAVDGGETDRRRTVTHAATFVLGFTLVFTIIGASVGLIAALISEDSAYFIRDMIPMLSRIAGVFLIVLGLNLIGVIRIPWLYRTYTLETAASSGTVSVGGGAAAMTMGRGGATGGPAAPPGIGYAKSLGVGAAFAIGWTPCIGPVLGAILTLSASSADVAQGAYLLLVYSLGLGVPFIITGLAVGPTMRFLRRYDWLMPFVEITTGVLIIFVGVLIFLDEATIFNSFFSSLPFLDRLNEI